MAFDEMLAERIRDHLEGRPEIAEKKMFGGLSFLLSGNLAVGVIGDELCVRVGPDAGNDALARPGTRPFDMTGRPMKGWVMVGGADLGAEDDLAEWIGRGLAFAGTLPPK